MAEFICRAMQSRDLEAVIRIQAEVYIDEILETDEVIHARFAQTPDTSWVVERAGEVCGYLVGYQSALGEVSPWGSEFTHKSESTALYLHDLAISKSAAGCGLGPLLVNYALMEARQRALRAAALVSVQNSKSFWQKLGFNECAQLDEIQQQNLASYSGPAIYMTRELAC
ncbi:MAG: GNAT family N-acetyltransferase [Cellvibrio sp.]|uniref:GNAT family N-acetyltransferase n=1 Tax=Cellvibrio sp. TaxID=1965322 RepID=UPI002722E54E|nr:GNAT family N-acetyltransferase [Cellvibrio sp.]